MDIDHRLGPLFVALGNAPMLHEGGPIDLERFEEQLAAADTAMARGLKRLLTILQAGKDSPELEKLAKICGMPTAELFELRPTVAAFVAFIELSEAGLLAFAIAFAPGDFEAPMVIARP